MSAACGRQGEHEQAMRLFRLMKDEGLNPDRIAYNAMFNSLKRAKQADVAYELWYVRTIRSIWHRKLSLPLK